MYSMKKYKKMLRLLLSVIPVLLLVACDTGGGTTSPPDPSITATPGTDAPNQGENNQGNSGSNVTDDYQKEIEKLFKEQQVVYKELSEDSIGANEELLATLKNEKEAYEYQLNPDDYNVTFELKEKESSSWTPFIGSKETTFTVSDSSVIEYEVVRKTIKFTALKEGECVITANNGTKNSTAYVKVLSLDDERDSGYSVDYYIWYLASELQPLDDVQKAEYMMSLADYAAIQQASSNVDGNLMSAMGAACLLYPTSYLINNYASLLMDQQMYEEALLWLEQADQADPGNPIILTNIAECCYELGDMQMAMSYSNKAISSQSDFGLAHLIQACVYRKWDDRDNFIKSLFRSAKTCWCELTTILMEELYDYVVKGVEEKDVMVITKEQLDILMEAVAYGTTNPNRNLATSTVSLGFPAPVTSAALTAQKGYYEKYQQLYQEVKALYYDARNYEGTQYSDDVRHVYIARFHILYYEYLIDKKGGADVYMEERKRLEKNFDNHYNDVWAGIDEQLAEWGEILAEHYQKLQAALALSVVDDQTAAEVLQKEIKWLQENIFYYEQESCKLQLTTLEGLRDEWHTVLIHIEEAKMNGYEMILRPILEEYYQRMNEILSYMTSDLQRKYFEQRMLWTINNEAILIPLSYAGADLQYEVNKYDAEIESLRSRIDNAYSDKLKAQTEEVQAKAEKAKLEEAKTQKQEWGNSFQIGLPPLSPIQVYIGYTEDGITYGYGAFGHDIMYERNFKTGQKTESIISSVTSPIPGLDQLSQNVNDICNAFGIMKDANEANKILNSLGDLSKYAKGKVVGGLPSFGETTATGVVHVYDRDGKLVDSSRVNKKAVGTSWGLLGIQVETTSKQKVRHNGSLSNSLNTSTKAKINVGGFTFEKDVAGEIK